MGWFDRLRSGLGKSSQALSDGISRIFTGQKLDAELLQELEDMLISADLGIDASQKIIENIRTLKTDTPLDSETVRPALAAEIAKLLEPSAQPLKLPTDNKPAVILMTGVNGAGKTTTIGKLAQKFQNEGKSVMLAAGDTFRAAAIEQLQIWGERAGVPVITTKPGGDAAGLAFSALEQAKAKNIDVLMIDTAGRLQSNDNLMAELEKILRVVRKLDDSAPHASILILDATTGQNALSQAKAFKESAEVTGIIMTKLDGTARGGVLLAVSQNLDLPIHFIGVGETADDLQIFDPLAFAQALTGVEP
jgi:fused signal recognition particle receptor